ncbi:MAG: cupin domain-containing protein [Candidatus Woesearchaeota archaeon]|mgnify:FL=1|jgi:dTDP-4-dehydrorhamnose 3,5-epimerase-like enzyme|nr:cupin domain-containing protein [Candidatus Woesearchaeota archaeon]MDP7181019.1 cupin domain-containing protein [Candidatus Woesearchaeota archaeon]MDP7198360.1 cupin domain-containing protein [Candidatus Woesearchaeota archaeon]MDP7467462.1 cupin domain-containing protein [Candidatus Woesearchaeota archaeon]MDP7647689.1 cupin domain-containing protein [Candidatus Woesearchaeota archaeon]|tara:strand:+ start:542 stop:976 length:435 start_codon:yes stop_codon:yes gene_type:complete
MDRPTIVKGADPFKDERGSIDNFYFDEDPINWIGLIHSIGKGIVRANHFHPIQTQKCLVTKGKYISVFKNLKDENAKMEHHLVQEGDVEIMPPNWAHAMVFVEDTTFLNLVAGERKHENYGEHTKPITVVKPEEVQSYLDQYGG